MSSNLLMSTFFFVMAICAVCEYFKEKGNHEKRKTLIKKQLETNPELCNSLLAMEEYWHKICKDKWLTAICFTMAFANLYFQLK